MPQVKTLVALYLPYLTLVRAISIPSPLQVLSVNHTIPSILIPNGASNLSEPSKPSGFEARLTFQEISLSPIEVYIDAVEMMSVLSNIGWDNYVKRSMGLSGNGRFSTEACVFPTLPGTGEASWLPAKYAISGLYQAGVEIANTQRFQELDVSLFVKDLQGIEQKVGYVEFRLKKPPPGLQPYQTVETNVDEAGYSNVSVWARPKRRIIDRKDQRFYITYDWNGHVVKSQDLFTSFLNALSIASVHDNASLEAYIPNAPAASGNVVLTTWSSGGPAADKLTWERVKRAIQLIWEEIIMTGAGAGKPRFEDFEFEMWYSREGRALLSGDRIGGGRVMKFGPDGPEGETVFEVIMHPAFNYLKNGS